MGNLLRVRNIPASAARLSSDFKKDEEETLPLIWVPLFQLEATFILYSSTSRKRLTSGVERGVEDDVGAEIDELDS